VINVSRQTAQQKEKQKKQLETWGFQTRVMDALVALAK